MCHLHIKVPVPQEILGVADSSPRDLQPDREASSFASMPEMLTVQGFPAKLEASRSQTYSFPIFRVSLDWQNIGFLNRSYS